MDENGNLAAEPAEAASEADANETESSAGRSFGSLAAPLALAPVAAVATKASQLDEAPLVLKLDAPTDVPSAPITEAPSASKTEQTAAAPLSEPAPVHEPEAAAVATSTAEPAPAPAPSPAEASHYVLPVDALQATAQAAGLQWVQSNAEAIRRVQAELAAQPAPIHVPRERKPAPKMDDGPLILVETVRPLPTLQLAENNRPTA